MNLVVDIGNTQVKAAAIEGTTIAELVTFPSAEQADLAPLIARHPIKRAIVASTGRGAAYVIDKLKELGTQVLVMTPDTPVPIGKEYLTPHTLGSDRVAAAVGAEAVYGRGDYLIVDFGTAITIDLVCGSVFRGGNISPGMRTRFRALHDYTSRLPECSPTDESIFPARCTTEAIEQGVMQGITYEIEGYIRSLTEKNVKLSIIFTGGDAKYFVKRIKNAIFAKCELVICGLNRILDYNATEQADI